MCLKCLSVALLAWCLAATVANAQTASLAPGSYRCASYNVSGGAGSCRNMQPLVLHADQRYQFSSTAGHWSTQGGSLQLSHSPLWGPGQILGHDTVRFVYDYRGWRHTVTWICQQCSDNRAIDKSAPVGDNTGGAYRGVSLILTFSSAIGGVNGFTIVPAELARGYTHNAALPAGAVQGLAREAGATSVALATNAANKLQSGRPYVVFLSWPRETLPVATFKLPAGSTDYQTTLSASLR